jgi:hypothetical protein
MYHCVKFHERMNTCRCCLQCAKYLIIQRVIVSRGKAEMLSYRRAGIDLYVIDVVSLLVPLSPGAPLNNTASVRNQLHSNEIHCSVFQTLNGAEHCLAPFTVLC